MTYRVCSARLISKISMAFLCRVVLAVAGSKGRYSRFGMRANQRQMERKTDADIEFQAHVALAEISGSETFVHVIHNDETWTVQLQGIHNYRIDEQIQVYVDQSRLYVFDLDGQLVASPDSASQ